MPSEAIQYRMLSPMSVTYRDIFHTILQHKKALAAAQLTPQEIATELAYRDYLGYHAERRTEDALISMDRYRTEIRTLYDRLKTRDTAAQQDCESTLNSLMQMEKHNTKLFAAVQLALALSAGGQVDKAAYGIPESMSLEDFYRSALEEPLEEAPPVEASVEDEDDGEVIMGEEMYHPGEPELEFGGAPTGDF